MLVIGVTGLKETSIKDDLTLSQTTNFRPFQTERACSRKFQI